MGFNTKSKETSQSNDNSVKVGGTIFDFLDDFLLKNVDDNSVKVGGLVFDSVDDYLLLKNVDDNIKQTVKLIEDGSIDLKEYFNNIKKINVKETYYGAAEELEGLFVNASYLLCFEGTRFDNDCKVGRCFFKKIKIEYCDSESDIEFDLNFSSDDDDDL